MEWAALYCGGFRDPCGRCGGALTLHVAETVDGDRLTWTVTTTCGGCHHADRRHDRPAGFDDDGIVRETLVARVGLVRLHADPIAHGERRRRCLAVFRGRRATIAETAAAYAALTGDGLVGTPGEMTILAAQLRAAGVVVTLRPRPA